MDSYYLGPRLDHSLSVRPARSAATGVYGVAVALVLIALYVCTSVAPVIWDETEGQYAGGAREMWDRGDWVAPSNDGIPRLQKPPVLYWGILTSYTVFGVNEFGARLPNALASLAWFLVVGLIGREVGGGLAGVRSAYVLATAFGTFLFCHLIMPEPLLGLFLALTVWCFLRALSSARDASAWMTLAWVFMAMGSLSKGLHAVAYPLLIAVFASLLMPTVRPTFGRLIQWLGPLLFLFILVPWYVVVEMRYPGFLWDHFVNEQLGHISNNRWPPDSDRAPLLPFLFQHLVLWLPWLVFVPSVLVAVWNKPGQRTRTSGANYLILWLWVIITFLSVLFSARQDYYTMTCWSALAVLFALGAERVGDLGLFWRLAPSGVLGVLGLALVTCAVVITSTLADAPIWVAAAENRENIWNAIRGFSLGKWLELATPMLWTGVAFFLAGGLGAFFAWMGQMERVYAVTAAGMVAVLSFATVGLSEVEDYFSLAPAAKVLNQRASANAVVVYQGEPHLASSLFYYLDRPVHWIDTDARIEFASRELGIKDDLFLTREEFRRHWNSEQSVYFITEQDRVAQWRPALRLTPVQAQPITRSGTRVVLWNGRR